jgi:hypothetical protein
LKAGSNVTGFSNIKAGEGIFILVDDDVSFSSLDQCLERQSARTKIESDEYGLRSILFNEGNVDLVASCYKDQNSYVLRVYKLDVGM